MSYNRLDYLIGSIKNRRFIDERSAIIDDKTRLGDWEIDTIDMLVKVHVPVGFTGY